MKPGESKRCSHPDILNNGKELHSWRWWCVGTDSKQQHRLHAHLEEKKKVPLITSRKQSEFKRLKINNTAFYPGIKYESLRFGILSELQAYHLGQFKIWLYGEGREILQELMHPKNPSTSIHKNMDQHRFTWKKSEISKNWKNWWINHTLQNGEFRQRTTSAAEVT